MAMLVEKFVRVELKGLFINNTRMWFHKTQKNHIAGSLCEGVNCTNCLTNRLNTDMSDMHAFADY